MDLEGHKCSVCGSSFSVKSNLTRHMQLHGPKGYVCEVCGKSFSLKQQLSSHQKQHLYPCIRLYRQGEAKLQCTDAAKSVAVAPSKAVDPSCVDSEKAEAAAKKAGGEMWKGQLVVTFGKYAGQSFRWLLENDVGWVIWLLSEYCQKGEKNDLLKWQKERLLQYAREFPPVTFHLDKRLEESRKDKGKKAESTLSKFQQDPDYASDAELLAAAETVLEESEVAVSTQLTTWGELTPAVSQDSSHSLSTSQGRPSSPVDTSASETGNILLEGWQKYWEHPPPSTQANGIAPPNIKWLKCDEMYGLFERPSRYKNAKGEIVERRLLKEKMQFHPPPIPTSVKGGLPNMMAFFTTPAFFWRPVGVMQAKIRCPSSNCPAPPGEYLEKKGFGSYARQVCGMKYNYTLLTEKLKCSHCEKMRRALSKTHSDADSEDEDSHHVQQYIWLAHSPKILMNLAPAIRSMFPAILCGKRAIDKGVVTLLNDRVNSVSMNKVQRVLQQGHDEWYVERRDLYQTLLYEAHTAGSAPSQKSILSFVKAAGTYTPPLPRTPLPCARVLRRAHMIMEMERMPVYRTSILSVTGEILCIDGTRKVLKKIYGDGQGTMQYVTSVLNEWGQFLTTVVVAAESEGCYRRMAKGLMGRFERAKAPAPTVIYADNNCCRDSGSSFLENLFGDWVQKGTVVRLDIRHWLHRWDAVVIKQSHAKYGVFMSALAGAVLAYYKDDMMLLIQAVRKGNQELYASLSDEDMIAFLKPHQIRSYVRRITRGVEETASAIESIITEFKGSAGLDIDGIHLFKSAQAVDSHWATASKHLRCMQDPPGIQLYVSVKVVVLNGVRLNKYRCRRGSNSLEGLHSHLYNAIPSQRCGVMPFQVYLIAFAVQWNSRMKSLRVAGGHGRQTWCMDPRQIQRLNQQADVLFGKEHVLEPNFASPMPYPAVYKDPDEEELLGVEYAMCQSTSFTARNYYAQQVEEEQSREEEETAEQSEDKLSDEGVDMGAESEEDPMDTVSDKHVILTQSEQVEEEDSPALQDVLMTQSHLHLPGLEEGEALALLILELADNSDRHLVPADLRLKIGNAVGALHEHDRSAANFVKRYESRWGYTLFGRCFGADTPETRAAQKTKFSWMKYPQSAQVTEDSRLLYLIIKMLKNRPPASRLTSPTKITNAIKGQYKRIVDRVRDDPILKGLSIPLPNLNAKSISTFMAREEKKANYRATVMPKVKPHQRVLSEEPMPAAPTLPESLPAPDRPQVQYQSLRHTAGKRHGQKRKVDVEMLGNRPIQPNPPVAMYIPPRASAAPVLVVVPAQPQGPSMMLCGASSSQGFIPFTPPPALTSRPIKPHKSMKPCGACQVPQCGGQRKRYTPSKDKAAESSQKIFTYCPATRKSTTSGFEGVVFNSFEHFKSVVDEELKKKKNNN
ncbi:hypothetical protein M9458_051654 [Cirrhinus mrigala]|uniref:C2H2-type domain-containing protein n=1 Tax=Cirrhinus mrigala TaxID=683832 RepID=A0ABD0MTZ3_CIRMR